MLKKSHLLPLVVFTNLLCFCSKETPIQPKPERAPQDAITTAKMSIDDAQKEVLAFINSFDPITRADHNPRIIESSFSLGGHQDTKTSVENGDVPLIHVFNFENNQGYAIAAGDRRVSPILCITEEGSISQDSVIENPGLLVALTEIDTYYRLMTGLPVTDKDGAQVIPEHNLNPLQLYSVDTLDVVDPPAEYSYVYGNWEDYSETGTALPCKWNQTYPFNNNCTTSDGLPAYVGCVAIAVGQIMYHWGKNYSYKNTYWNWSTMRHVIDYSSIPSDTRSWDLVQRLLSTLGLQENLDMNYGAVADKKGSSASCSKVSRTFENFGYADGGSLEEYNFNTLKQNLIYGPVLGCGYDTKTVKINKIFGIQVNKKTTYSGGHAWVYDKALVQRRQIKEYKDGLLNNTFYETRNFVHINWGWGGQDDGYYFSTRLDTNSGPALTRGTTTYGVDGYYQYKLEMNCGIRAN